jgi:hypothetical protein
MIDPLPRRAGAPPSALGRRRPRCPRTAGIPSMEPADRSAARGADRRLAASPSTPWLERLAALPDLPRQAPPGTLASALRSTAASRLARGLVVGHRCAVAPSTRASRPRRDWSRTSIRSMPSARPARPTSAARPEKPYDYPYAAVAAIKDHLAFYPGRVGHTRPIKDWSANVRQLVRDPCECPIKKGLFRISCG